MRTIYKRKGRFGQFLPGPNEAHDYEPQAYFHPGVSFYGHGVYWLVRQIEKVSGAPPAGVLGASQYIRGNKAISLRPSITETFTRLAGPWPMPPAACPADRTCRPWRPRPGDS